MNLSQQLLENKAAAILEILQLYRVYSKAAAMAGEEGTAVGASLEKYLEKYRTELLESVVPFWMRHAEDAEHGGIFTCVSDQGAVVQGDKWLWSQFRAVWVFAKLYNSFTAPSMAAQRAEWLRFALAIYDFCVAHGWREDAADGSGEPGWALCLSAAGEELKGCESVYVDCFAIYGMAELYRATRRADVGRWGRRSADALLRRLRALNGATPAPLGIPAFPYPIPAGQKVHGIPMMLANTLWELGGALQEPRYRDAALRCHEEIFEDFLAPATTVATATEAEAEGEGDGQQGGCAHKPCRHALMVERVRRDVAPGDGQPRGVPGPGGTACVPGHVIEDMWFQIHIARERGGAAAEARVAQCAALMLSHLEAGWDEEHGGILLGIDALGGEEVGWLFADTKLWWPHTEALYGLLLAYEVTGDARFLAWHEKVHEWTYAHFPLAGTGEWVQKLDRTGAPLTTTIALPVKDPFHLPRALIYCVEVLERLLAKQEAGV